MVITVTGAGVEVDSTGATVLLSQASSEHEVMVTSVVWWSVTVSIAEAA